MGRSEEPNMELPILGSQYLVNYWFWIIWYYRTLKEKNGTPKDEGNYWGYKEQGNGQLQNVQSFQRTTNNSTALC